MGKKTNDSLESKIENITKRIEQMKRDLASAPKAATRVCLRTKIECAEESLSRLIDKRDNNILSNKIAQLIAGLAEGDSIQINMTKLVTPTTFQRWKNIEVSVSVTFGTTTVPSIDKLTAEALNAREFLNSIRATHKVEYLDQGKIKITKIKQKTS